MVQVEKYRFEATDVLGKYYLMIGISIRLIKVEQDMGMKI